MSKRRKKFVINDIDNLQKEFFRTYDPDYWLCKIVLLKNSNDNYSKIYKNLKTDLPEINDELFKRMTRTEMHFLYFQMIESLFEIIFAIIEHNNRDLWLALTFSNDKKTEYYSNCYNKIKDFAEGSYIEFKNYFFSLNNITLQNKEIEMPLLRWIFYFNYQFEMSEKKWKINLDNIFYFLRKFAKDFSDRGEYNAYKHSLRFYNAPSNFFISTEGSEERILLGASEDSIIYLEEMKTDNKYSKKIARTVKPFDFEADARCCYIIYELIRNIIFTRKYQILNELDGKKFNIMLFLDTDKRKYNANTGVKKSSSAL